MGNKLCVCLSPDNNANPYSKSGISKTYKNERKGSKSNIETILESQIQEIKIDKVECMKLASNQSLAIKEKQSQEFSSFLEHLQQGQNNERNVSLNTQPLLKEEEEQNQTILAQQQMEKPTQTQEERKSSTMINQDQNTYQNEVSIKTQAATILYNATPKSTAIAQKDSNFEMNQEDQVRTEIGIEYVEMQQEEEESLKELNLSVSPKVKEQSSIQEMQNQIEKDQVEEQQTELKQKEEEENINELEFDKSNQEEEEKEEAAKKLDKLMEAAKLRAISNSLSGKLSFFKHCEELKERSESGFDQEKGLSDNEGGEMMFIEEQEEEDQEKRKQRIEQFNKEINKLMQDSESDLISSEEYKQVAELEKIKSQQYPQFKGEQLEFQINKQTTHNVILKDIHQYNNLRAPTIIITDYIDQEEENGREDDEKALIKMNNQYGTPSNQSSNLQNEAMIDEEEGSNSQNDEDLEIKRVDDINQEVEGEEQKENMEDSNEDEDYFSDQPSNTEIKKMESSVSFQSQQTTTNVRKLLTQNSAVSSGGSSGAAQSALNKQRTDGSEMNNTNTSIKQVDFDSQSNLSRSSNNSAATSIKLIKTKSGKRPRNKIFTKAFRNELKLEKKGSEQYSTVSSPDKFSQGGGTSEYSNDNQSESNLDDNESDVNIVIDDRSNIDNDNLSSNNYESSNNSRTENQTTSFTDDLSPNIRGKYMNNMEVLHELDEEHEDHILDNSEHHKDSMKNVIKLLNDQIEEDQLEESSLNNIQQQQEESANQSN